MKKSSSIWVIAVVAILIIGGTVYLGNTKLQKGSFVKIPKIGATKLPKNIGTTVSTTCEGQQIYKSDTGDFAGLLNALKSNLTPENCSYLFSGNDSLVNPKLSVNLVCNKNEIQFYENDPAKKEIKCVKNNMSLALRQDKRLFTTVEFGGKAGIVHILDFAQVTKMPSGYNYGL